METFWFFWLRFRRAYDSAYDSDFWFSLGHKRSYDSDFDSVASENQLLGCCAWSSWFFLVNPKFPNFRRSWLEITYIPKKQGPHELKFCWKKELKIRKRGENDKTNKKCIWLLGHTSKGARSLKTTFYFSTPKICMQDFQNSKIKRYTLKMCELLKPWSPFFYYSWSDKILTDRSVFP